MKYLVKKHHYEFFADYEIIDTEAARRISLVTKYKKSGTVQGFADMKNGEQRPIVNAKAYLEMCLAEYPVKKFDHKTGKILRA